METGLKPESNKKGPDFFPSLQSVKSRELVEEKLGKSLADTTSEERLPILIELIEEHGGIDEETGEPNDKHQTLLVWEFINQIMDDKSMKELDDLLLSIDAKKSVKH